MGTDKKLTVLELFSGTESFSTCAKELGHETITMDWNPRFNATIIADIMELTADDFEDYDIDVVWASPDCSAFSVASISTHWGGGNKCYIPKSTKAQKSVAVLEHLYIMIKELNPLYYYIENPRGLMRKMKIMENYPIRNTVTYCQYGDDRMKPTDIWTNDFGWHPRSKCKNGDSCHTPAPRGSKTGTQGRHTSMERARVPEELCKEIIMGWDNDNSDKE